MRPGEKMTLEFCLSAWPVLSRGLDVWSNQLGDKVVFKICSDSADMGAVSVGFVDWFEGIDVRPTC